jgi:allophycocyanin beta subunit
MNNWNELISKTIDSADNQGKYIDSSVMEKLKNYFQASERKVRIATKISANRDTIVQETMTRQLKLRHSRISTYRVRQYVACIRDLDYFLRYSTYAMLAGDPSILDERVLSGLVETYLALNIPIDTTVNAIRTMQEVVACLIGQEDSQEMDIYLNYLCEQLSKNARHITSSLHIYTKSSQDWQSWEPTSSEEWLNQDPLAQEIQQSGAEDPYLEDSAEGFFESLSHIPYNLRKQVWREREIMAALYKQMAVWKKIPGFISVSVARREINGKSRLVGILSFQPEIPVEFINDRYGVPSLIKVDSSISELLEHEKDIPILLEIAYVPVHYNANIRLDITSSLKSTILMLQSGDKIAGRSNNGLAGSPVTLTTFVIPKKSCDIITPHLLTVRHGFSGYTDIVICEPQAHVKVGEVIYDTENIQWQNLADQLDITLVRIDPDQNCLLKPHLRWVDEYPRKPIPIFAGMPVQMFGGSSGHVLGTIDESMIIYPGPNPSIIPNFSATIPSQSGDSGALLVVGHHSKLPVPDYLEEYISDDWHSLVYCMQGILLAGCVGTMYGNKAIFRPMINVLHWLKLQPYLS